MSGHTPGPWTCTPVEDGSYALNPSGAGWLRCTKDETWANARLIAAAPELLAACGVLLAIYDEHLGGLGLPGVREARAAIAKAEGRA